tara:strand:+ start:9001 stop:10191 length:1191 start_codon:yes stop_codon:yes gene_type:complete
VSLNLQSIVIKKIELILFPIKLKDIAENKSGLGVYYSPGNNYQHLRFGIKVYDNLGNVGEYIPPRGRSKVIMSACEALSHHVINENPFHKDKIYRKLRGLTKHIGEVGIGAIDIAIHDLIGKYLNVSVSNLLGLSRKKIPAYASTMPGDREKKGLSSPEAYADFAEKCYSIGYKAFKMHGWSNGNVSEEIAMIKAVAERVNGKMKIMYDSACHLSTLTDALEVGKVCDEYNLYWYEDPYKDGGVSINGNATLAQSLSTPILIGEHVRNLETSIDLLINGASFFSRADPDYDGGITGCYKLGVASEGLGMDCEVHSCGPAMRHLMAACRNSNFYEVNLLHPKCDNAWSLPVYLDGYSDQIDCVDKDGNVDVSDKPGLGVIYDWNYIQKQSIETIVIT